MVRHGSFFKTEGSVEQKSGVPSQTPANPSSTSRIPGRFSLLLPSISMTNANKKHQNGHGVTQLMELWLQCNLLNALQILF